MNVVQNKNDTISSLNPDKMNVDVNKDANERILCPS